MMWKRTTCAVLALVAAVAPPDACAQELTWQTAGEVAVVEGLGGTGLRFRSGTATLQGRDIQDGSVSFVLKSPPARGFIGLRFREQSDGSYEDFYLRPHKHNAPDALQYTPSFSGMDTNWQLFHGPGGTASSPTQNTEQGIAVEIVFEGRDAAIFIGDDTFTTHDLATRVRAQFTFELPRKGQSRSLQTRLESGLVTASRDPATTDLHDSKPQ